MRDESNIIPKFLAVGLMYVPRVLSMGKVECEGVNNKNFF